MFCAALSRDTQGDTQGQGKACKFTLKAQKNTEWKYLFFEMGKGNIPVSIARRCVDGRKGGGGVNLQHCMANIDFLAYKKVHSIMKKKE